MVSAGGRSFNNLLQTFVPAFTSKHLWELGSFDIRIVKRQLDNGDVGESKPVAIMEPPRVLHTD